MIAMKTKTERIYIATSWQLQNIAKLVAKQLRWVGFQVDCFCDNIHGRFVFNWPDLVDKNNSLKNHDAKSFIDDPRVIRAFNEDKKWLDWADTVILIVPSGRSAHLEAGYAKGQGKRLYVYGGFVKGEFDVMYRFADGLFRMDEFPQLVAKLKEI